MVKLLAVLLLCFCLSSSAFAYPVSDDTYLSIKDYAYDLSNKVNEFGIKANSITDVNERNLFIIYRDCIVICREILNALTYFINANNPDPVSISSYCNERLTVVDNYIKMMQGATNILNRDYYDSALKTLINTKRALEKVLSEIRVN
jgi:hypothetical protein